MKSQYILGIIVAVSLTLTGCGGGGDGGTTPVSTAPSFTTSTATVVEGNAGTSSLDFTVTLSEALTSSVTVDYYTADGTATAGIDYTAIPATTVVIPAGSTTATVSVNVTGDTLYETDETVTLYVSSSSHTSLGSAVVVGTITNDDTAPSLSIANASVVEGNAGTINLDFTATLSAISVLNTTIDYATSNGTASAGNDYTTVSGTLTIPAGSTTGTITVVVSGDTTFEVDETLTVTLSNSGNATIATATAVGTITNDDTIPSLSVANASVVEGNSGSSNLVFTVTLNTLSGVATTVDYVTSNITAITGSDYTAGSGTLNIPAGAAWANIVVQVTGDTTFELDETLDITLSNPSNTTILIGTATGTITNDDTAPTVSIANVSVVEGNAGTTNMNFTVTLSAVSGLNTTVDIASSDGTALAGSDYTAASGAVNIPAGLTTRTVTVLVSGDTTLESDETLTATMSNPINATLATVTATGTIVDDDTPTSPTAVNLAISGKSLDFSWTAGVNVDHYRILVNPDGVSGFTVDPYASNIAGTTHSLEIPVHKTNWLAAQYIVEACDAGEASCVASLNQTLALIDSVAASIYVKASNTGALDEFGWSISLSSDGNTLAVGAKFEGSNANGINGDQTTNSVLNAGAVYVFVKTGATWSQQAFVKASNTGGEDRFGYAVSLSGDGNVLAVSARQEYGGTVGIGGNDADNTAPSSGAVYVFVRTGTTWTQQAYVKASNTEASDYFGSSLALSSDGSTLAVSAVHEDSAAIGINGNQTDNTALSAGAVYIFINNGVTWAQQAYIKASNAEAGDQFGRSLSLNIDGNTLAVAANSEASAATGINGNQADNTAINAGAVYVFARTGTTWAQQAYIKASNAEAGDLFGTSIALSDDGNLLAAGANFEDSTAIGVAGNQASNGSPDSGAVYLFSRTGSGWLQQTYIKASNTGISDEFGYTVSLSADGATLAAGARREDSVTAGINGDEVDNTAGNSGAVYIFINNGGTWTQKSYVKAPTTGPADWFSYSISLSGNGDTLAIGANLEDSAATGIGGNQADNTASKSGAVYLY